MIKKIILSLGAITLLSLLSLYFILNYTNIWAEPTYTVGQRPSYVLNGISKEYIEEEIKIDEEKGVYVGLNILTEDIDIDIIWDNKNETAILYDGENIIRIYGQDNAMKINRNVVDDSSGLLLKDVQPLLSTKLIEDYSDYETKYINSTNIVVIDGPNSIKKEASAIKRVRIRADKSIWAEVTDIVNIGDKLFVYEEVEDWSYVRTDKGLTGFIKTSDLSVERIIKENSDIEVVSQPARDKINMTWEYVYRKTPEPDKLKTVNGLDVISPTWFSLSNANGDINNKASIDYVRWAHGNGYEVWGLFGNGFDPEMTSTIINDSFLREKVINRIIDLALAYDLDGINIDFENVFLKDKDMFTQFVKEMYPVAKEKELTLSIDVTIKSMSENWSMFYDRPKLSHFVDYMALMAYDEHWAGGGISGSVASLPWVERGVQTLIEDVPSRKVLLGVPFYTRVWKEEIIDGEIKVQSYAVSMERADELIKENNGTVIWDDRAKQYYGEYKKGNSIYKVWIEDERSMKERVDIIKKYNLAGIASWRRGFEKEVIWDVISNNLR